MSEAEAPYDWRTLPPATRHYAEVIGDPISQSKSPKIHGFWLGKLEIEADYRAAHVKPEDLAAYLTARRADRHWRGCNVTMPHKQAVMGLVDKLDPLAERVGAVNTVVRESDGRLTGYNTDVPGFLEPLRPLLDETHYFRMARVLGTGGAARAIITALAGEKLIIVLAGRNPAKARALLDELDPAGEHHVADLAHFADSTDFAFDDRELCLDLVVNASSLGMVGQPPLNFDLSHAPPGSVFYDIVTSPLDTAFLRAARAAGFRTIDGLSMLIGQADYAFRHFFGAMPPRDDGDRALRLLLGARPYVLGLTGSIGMGKSAVAAMLRDDGVPVFDADAEVHRLQGPDGALLPEIEAAFPGTTGPTGVDRPKLGAAVFGNPEALARLEAIMHPAVGAARAAFMTANAAAPLVVFDVPLLFEKGGWQDVDGVAVVSAPAEAQAARVLARPGMTPEKFAHILALQVPDAEKRARADFVIDTGTTLEETRGAVKALVVGLLAGRN